MPISPTVGAWMQNMQGQQGQPMDADSLFKKSVQDQAFNALRAKAPALLPHVVTFRCLESDVDAGSALGAFAITSGNDLAFVPIVMSSGSVTSCEMLYLRDEDQFVPLSGQYIQNILNKNTAEIAKPMAGDVRVEDTRRMFRNIIRPPASSNVVLASGRIDISELPNHAKAKIAAYFNEHPDVLAKLATFYPVDVLASKLAATATDITSEQSACVLGLSDMDKVAVECLPANEKNKLLERGWVFKGAVDATKITADPGSFGAEVENRLSEHDITDAGENVVWAGDVLRFVDGSFKFEPVAIFGKSVGHEERNKAGDKINRHWYFDRACKVNTHLVNAKGETAEIGGAEATRNANHIVVRDKHAATKSDLLALGFSDITGVKAQLNKQVAALKECGHNPEYARYNCFVAVPRRQGHYSFADELTLDIKGTIAEGDDNAWLIADDRGRQLATVTSKITYGCFVNSPYSYGGKQHITLPKTALFRVTLEEYQCTSAFSGIINTLQQLFDITKRTGVQLRVQKSDGIIEVTNLNTQKTASFFSESDAAKYLHSEYNLTEPQIIGTLDRKHTFITTKLAADMMAPQAPMGLQGFPQGTPQQPQPQQMTQPQLLPQGNVQMPVFDPMAMQPFIDTQDPDMVDVGILASFAGDPDVKALLVDYLPDFTTVMDRLGRVILLFCLQKEELEQYYRVDKLNELLQNCRKIFRLVGDLVQALKLYINMA